MFRITDITFERAGWSTTVQWERVTANYELTGTFKFDMASEEHLYKALMNEPFSDFPSTLQRRLIESIGA